MAKEPITEGPWVTCGPRVWAIDPGAVATGVAYMHLDLYSWACWQHVDPRAVMNKVVPDLSFRDYLLVEDYSHGGAFTKEAKQTIEIIGYFKYTIPNVVLVHKDKRLSGQAEAARMMESTIPELKRAPSYKDAFSALSHCVVWRRDHGTGTNQ